MATPKKDRQRPAPVEIICPQSGWFLDWQWAEVLGQEVERFRETVRARGIHHIPWGYAMLVRAEDFYAAGSTPSAKK
ncbi:hypothetical protein [Planctomyces sp. SH-PL14]|uniref:hypothetical protein n=1 Tax=Planctomyces sp. SH-PL14 TaxID=1632864 RepID=UPI00078B65E8|nr:hypothetical protein [Planctomyces sp. SH-PL14]AMV16617.1 hypothetical protein VT03_01925 [Planctomyces sp. SH-PL14]